MQVIQAAQPIHLRASAKAPIIRCRETMRVRPITAAGATTQAGVMKEAITTIRGNLTATGTTITVSITMAAATSIMVTK